MSNVEQIWSQIGELSGKETDLLLQKPKDIQHELLLLHAHRHLIVKQVVVKGIDRCFSSLQGAFSSEALKIQYLVFARATKASLEELPIWTAILKQWIQLKFSPDFSEEFMLNTATSFPNIDSMKMLIAFLHCISEDLLQLIIKKHLKLSDMLHIDFKKETMLKIDITASQLLNFVNIVLPKSLFNTIIKNDQLPESLRGNKQLECLFSNRQLQYIIKICPNYSSLLKVILKIILSRFYQLDKGQERVLMEAAFRYFYLHHHDKSHSAVEILIECFNVISETVRFAMTEQFVLFLHIARKIGREKLVGLLLEKSNWLRDISEKTSFKKMIGYKLEGVSPFFGRFAERILIERGKSTTRYFQCVEEHTIVFLRVTLEDLDINIRISYAGDYIEKGPITFIPIEFQKVGMEFTQTIIFPQRGVYSIEFDNTYSWINGKTLDFQRVILSPLSYLSNSRFPFIDAYYLSKPMTTVAKQHLISIETGISTRVNVRRREQFFSFTIEQNGKEEYQYQTDSSLRLLKRLQLLLDSGRTFQFAINNKIVKNIQSVQKYLNEAATSKKDPDSPAKMKKEEVLIEIPLKY